MILRSQFMTSRRMNRSQNAVLSEGNTHGGRRYMPYMFTEQGIVMFSAVLKSDIAV